MSMEHECSKCKQPCEIKISVRKGTEGKRVTACCNELHFTRLYNEVMSHAYRKINNKNYK